MERSDQLNSGTLHKASQNQLQRSVHASRPQMRSGAIFGSKQALDGREGAEKQLRTIEPLVARSGQELVEVSPRAARMESLATTMEEEESRNGVLGRTDRKSTRKVVLESLPTGKRMHSIKKGRIDDNGIRHQSHADFDGAQGSLQDSTGMVTGTLAS